MDSQNCSISYKTETEQTFLDYKQNRFDDSANESDKIELYAFFKNLKCSFQSNDAESVLDILIDLTDYSHDEKNIPPNITTFFIDNDLLQTIITLLLNPLKEEILIYTLKIIYYLVHFSINDKLDFHHFLFQNNFLQLLFDIRESIPFNNIPTYLHLIANFSFCCVGARNQIMNQFPQDFLESLIIKQGEDLIDIRHETSFLIWRMTMYPIKEDDSLSIFDEWFIDFFSKSHLIFDLISLRYWLFALDNLIFEHKEIKPMMLISFGYFEVVEFFIKTRNSSFLPIPLENSENDNHDVIREENFFQERDEIDELLEIILKIIKLFIKSGTEFISTDIIFDLLGIASENWRICSEFSIKIIKSLIKKSHKIFVFNEIDNIQTLLNIYDLVRYSFKYEIIFLLHEIISNDKITTSYIVQIGPIVIPKLIENLNDTNDTNLIQFILDLFSTFFMIGVRRNGYEENEFYQIFIENDGLDFIYNYREKLESLDIDEYGLSNLNSRIKEIKEYLGIEDEIITMDDEMEEEVNEEMNEEMEPYYF